MDTERAYCSKEPLVIGLLAISTVTKVNRSKVGISWEIIFIGDTLGLLARIREVVSNVL